MDEEKPANFDRRINSIQDEIKAAEGKVAMLLKEWRSLRGEKGDE
jgi:hypothetical protein